MDFSKFATSQFFYFIEISMFKSALPQKLRLKIPWLNSWTVFTYKGILFLESLFISTYIA